MPLPIVLSACGVNRGDDAFLFLLLEMPPVRAPNAVNFPAEIFQNPLPSPVACSGDKRIGAQLVLWIALLR